MLQVLSKKVFPENHFPVFPEKVLQFGTGVLLRGLCDYFIDKANKQGIFEGSIVVVKSTGTNTDEFDAQDNLYTLCIRGLDKGQPAHENYVSSAISRVVSAKTDWKSILETAHNPAIEIIISNTTEVGLTFVEESIHGTPPESYPAKLTAWLYERFTSNKKNVVVVPTELIVDNGKILKAAVLNVIKFNQLEAEFSAWVEQSVSFCSSLVDRIVPGKPRGEELEKLTKELGYQDHLMSIAEVYRLWAIEGDSKIKAVLSFEEADSGVKIEKNIGKYRELKLRLLNGTHTLMSGLGFLSGFETVKSLLDDELMEKYLTILMLTEVAPAIPYNIDMKVSQRYGREVMDRFRNPELDHRWISITLQYTMKMRMRCIPLLKQYYTEFETVPQYYARCFAAYLLFMKATKEENGKYFGELNEVVYPIQCDSAAYFYDLWNTEKSTAALVEKVLSNQELWGMNLMQFKDFAKNVETHLSNMQMIGVREVASALNVYA